LRKGLRRQLPLWERVQQGLKVKKMRKRGKAREFNNLMALRILMIIKIGN